MNAHWILQLNKYENKEEYTNASFYCSHCNCTPLSGSLQYPIYEFYCHLCGAHMIEAPTVEIHKINNNNDNETFGWESFI